MPSKRQIDKRKKMAMRKERKERGMQRPGAKSMYARKRAYLTRYGGWGFDYPTKPWK